MGRTDTKKAGAVVAAAGSGARFGGDPGLPKQLRPLCGIPVVCHAAGLLLGHGRIGKVVVVAPRALMGPFAQSLAPLDPKDGRLILCPGGATRGESVALGLKALGGEYSHAVIHDGARPLATATDVTRVLDKALEQGAAILARRLPDTLKKEAGESGTVAETLPREGLWLAQTPQAFSVALLEEAMGKGDPSGATDEASLVEATGAKVAIVPGDGWNLKITDREDLAMAEALLGARDGARGPGRARGPAPSLSVGQGWDFHRFAPDRELYLGCVHFGGPPGLAGHSDADVLTHALIDAILGAACLGDIGQHFPDGSEAFRGASGRELLTLAWGMAGKDHAIENLDLTLIGESPRIAPRRLEIREALAAILGIPVSRVNLKGKTTEGMGFLGRGEGLAASAVALLSRKGRKRPPRRPRGPFG